MTEPTPLLFPAPTVRAIPVTSHADLAFYLDSINESNQHVDFPADVIVRVELGTPENVVASGDFTPQGSACLVHFESAVIDPLDSRTPCRAYTVYPTPPGQSNELVLPLMVGTLRRYDGGR